MPDLLITSGVGPAQARQFVVQLARRLEQVAEERALVVRAVELHGEADAPRSAVLHLAGDASLLADELGTHVLVQRNVRGRRARKRFFAAVSLCAPVADVAAVPAIPRDELVITACRAGGPGGQHVNKVASAVRVQHVPTGIAIRCASERSQHANLNHALRRLANALAERARAGRDQAIEARRANHYRVERGRAVKSYVLDDDGDLVESTP